MDKLKCPHCSQAIDARAKYCPDCGNKIPETLRSPRQAEKAQVAPKSTALRDLIVIASVLAVVAAGYFLLKEKPLPPRPPESNMNNMSQDGHPDVPGVESGMSSKELEALPKDYGSLVMAGNNKMDSGNFPVAAECYRRALAIDGRSGDVRSDYAACLHGMGLPNRAIEEFKTVLKDDPRHTIAHFNLGIVFSEIKQVDSARAYFKEYLQLDPKGAAAEAAQKFLMDLGG